MKRNKARLVDELERTNIEIQAQTESLRENEAQLRLQATALEKAANAMVITDAKGVTLWVNPAFTALTGFSSGEMIGKNPRILKSGKHGPAFYAHLWQTILGGHTWRGEFINRRKDGTLFHGEQTITPVCGEQGRIEHFIGVMNDVTERKRAEDELRDSREQFRALAARLQEAREQERIRIAREMHDGLGEMLTGIEMGLAWLRLLLEPARPRIERGQMLDKIEEIDKLVGGTAERVRKLCTELRPSVLDDLGLVAAIEWQAREFQARTHIRCEAKPGVEMIAASRDQATAIFRIFQEILTNVARHAEASKVRVRLVVDRANLVLEVKDNGKGIPPGEIAGPKALGLLGMKERAGLLGGKVEIAGSPGKGTRVTVSIPIGQPNRITP